jgi:hypothetical protein
VNTTYPPNSMYEYCFELAAKSLGVVMVPPAPRSSPCVSGEAQDNNTESAGSPPLPTVYPEVK